MDPITIAVIVLIVFASIIFGILRQRSKNAEKNRERELRESQERIRRNASQRHRNHEVSSTYQSNSGNTNGNQITITTTTGPEHTIVQIEAPPPAYGSKIIGPSPPNYPPPPTYQDGWREPSTTATSSMAPQP
ncbi:hypothetical protein BDB00DRAFT_869434 [Zychaea mexicana]|uniref:uncharacterized protein n=1 Tax=Zychaea mexicana TaxID=64656 RepID=UPI0022FF29F9|nr:uncharacterized protein BDB00DRAFT_869434 [Zychaea mexicana]KAI9496497.1 hypothetical protein BDB00DRAFT_869434 [Zychaea mexicana]